MFTTMLEQIYDRTLFFLIDFAFAKSFDVQDGPFIITVTKISQIKNQIIFYMIVKYHEGASYKI